jgi:lipopolysaccharide transport system ATP-binding protein
MNKTAVRIRGLSKRYVIGTRPNVAVALTRKLVRAVRKQFTRRSAAPVATSSIWALKDVSFDISEGDVVGIIGGNGSGKSTLLKILARITDPTAGEVELWGRTGALLEVGTGFHSELTGRENVYLNGMLLGMQHNEITRKLDEIIDFSGVEKFLDTPVKRYSSGMAVRLAFAVAASLDSEILILDEILSVGDQAFQNKCLRKVNDLARNGRTVLIVSHNLSVIQNTCTRGILLQQGRVVLDGSIAQIMRVYSEKGFTKVCERVWNDDASAPTFPDGAVRLLSARVVGADGQSQPPFDVKEAFEIEVAYRVLRQQHVLNAHLYFQDETGQTIFSSMDHLDTPWKKPQPPGVYKVRCRLPTPLFNEGLLRIEYAVWTNPPSEQHVAFRDALVFSILDDMRAVGVRGDWSGDWPPALLRPRLHWEYS